MTEAADTVLTRWRQGRQELIEVLAETRPDARPPWFGGPDRPQTPAELAAARLMEWWAHGQDVADALGVTSPVTDRLRAELADHLGYDKHDPAGRNRENSRDGSRPKTVLTELGPVEIDVPRDRDVHGWTPRARSRRAAAVTWPRELGLLGQRPGPAWVSHAVATRAVPRPTSLRTREAGTYDTTGGRASAAAPA